MLALPFPTGKGLQKNPYAGDAQLRSPLCAQRQGKVSKRTGEKTPKQHLLKPEVAVWERRSLRIRAKRPPDMLPEGASWLQPDHRLSHHECLERIINDGGSVSPAFAIPWMTTSTLRIDWLHCADQGVAAVFLGGLFHMYMCDRANGPNEEARCARLWIEIQAFYAENHTNDRLNNLTLTMVKPKKGAIVLSANGAEVRALVPFGRNQVGSWREPLEPEAWAAKTCMNHLSRCYDFLRPTLEAQHDSLLDNALAFHANLLVLNEMNGKRWQVRPKVHMFLELCAEGGTPSSSWNYREESFGGSVAHQSHRRGGFSTPLAMSRSVLTKFCAKESLPRIR